jgi:cytochrome c oxidase assembly protein subunit 15
MTSMRPFRVASQLALATAVLMFGLIVIGSVVRSTGSGLACPDWPLCRGRLLPPLEFHVLIEWFHRLVALLVSVMLLSTAGWIAAHRALRGRLGGLAALAVVLLAAQIVLGALTVWKLLSPSVVSSHLAVALLLFSTLLTLALVAQTEAEGVPVTAPRPAGLLPTFGLATLLAYGQSLLGGLVSSSHAGLVCPDWPTCNGAWFPPLRGLVGLQMMHRFGAYLLTVVVLVAALRARHAPDEAVRAGAAMAAGLVLAQVALGVSNVFLGTPVWLSALHLANAAAILAMLVTITYRVASLPARALRLEPVPVP